MEENNLRVCVHVYVRVHVYIVLTCMHCTNKYASYIQITYSHIFSHIPTYSHIFSHTNHIFSHRAHHTQARVCILRTCRLSQPTTALPPNLPVKVQLRLFCMLYRALLRAHKFILQHTSSKSANYCCASKSSREGTIMALSHAYRALLRVYKSVLRHTSSKSANYCCASKSSREGI